MARRSPDILFFLKQYYFTIGVFFCIVLAEIAPFLGRPGGPLKPEITVKYFAVFIIFFTSGLTVKWNELSQAIKQYKLHVFIQSFAFICIPIFIQIFLFAFESLFDLNSWVHKGFIFLKPFEIISAIRVRIHQVTGLKNYVWLVIVGCMPPPVSSAVILTKSIGGNEAAAIFNSAIGSILGIVITPMLLLIHVGITSTLPVLKIVLQLFQTVIIPVLLAFGQISLLYIIYTSFCDMFLQEDFIVSAHVILITILLVVIVQIILLFATFQISFLLSKKKKMYTAQDVVTITLCSTHKSLTMGMPLLKTLYSGYSHLSQISLPLLIYHPVQLILGGALAPYGRKWVKKYSKNSSSYKRP